MKPRLLIIINRFVIGGQAADTIPLLYHLKDKYTIKVIYGEKEADEIEPLFLLQHYPGLDLQKLPSLKRSINPFADLISLYKIYQCIKSFKPDIVHTHGAKSGLTGRLAAKLYGHTVIVHTFHGHLFHSYFNKFTSRIVIGIEKVLSRITNAAIALSPSQKKELVEEFKVYPSHKVFEIPLGLCPPPSLNSYDFAFRNKYELNKEDVAIAIIGRIVPIKNHLDFLKIVINLIKKGIEGVKFFIIGDGNGLQDLVEILKHNNIPFALPGQATQEAKVIFTSWISNMYEVIYELDVVVLTSSNEGTPVSLIEAQLCGKPVVAYNVGGVKDTFIDNVSGFLVEKGNLSAFADRLITLINNKELRKSMGVKGKDYSSSKFSKLTEVSSVDNLYTMLLDGKHRRRTNIS
jgi:glycosyltransferase involved in cell wall biosynthesis